MKAGEVLRDTLMLSSVTCTVHRGCLTSRNRRWKAQGCGSSSTPMVPPPLPAEVVSLGAHVALDHVVGDWERIPRQLPPLPRSHPSPFMTHPPLCRDLYKWPPTSCGRRPFSPHPPLGPVLQIQTIVMGVESTSRSVE